MPENRSQRPKAYFSELAELEEHNWWFRSRKSSSLWILKKTRKSHDFLEARCGTDYVLDDIINALSTVENHDTEHHEGCLVFARARTPTASLSQIGVKKND